MNILVAGGAGYIGSHTCVALIEAGHSVIIADNLYNSDENVIKNIEKIVDKKIKFYKKDVSVESNLDEIFSNNKIDGVIHFAGYKAVGESVEIPLDYYYNNLLSTIALSKACLKYNVEKLVFSSSATVYGDNKLPFVESMDLLPTTNPYGETKVMCERILKDSAKAYNNFKVSILRYFNPIGAHKSGLIGEKPNGIPNNIMPYITQVAVGTLPKIQVFGNDYPTVDGTGVRDYIHVVDLAKGHVAALESLKESVEIYNLGTGNGTSVLQLIKTFENVNNIKIPFEISDRRVGDIAECYAGVKKANDKLKWKAELTVNDMVRDAWNFEKHLNNIKLK